MDNAKMKIRTNNWEVAGYWLEAKMIRHGPFHIHVRHNDWDMAEETASAIHAAALLMDCAGEEASFKKSESRISVTVGQNAIVFTNMGHSPLPCCYELTVEEPTQGT